MYYLSDFVAIMKENQHSGGVVFMSPDRRISKSKTALQDALLTLADDQPLDKLTVTQIVQQANLNRGTFYKHYACKEQLLSELIDDVLFMLVDAYRSPYTHKTHFSVEELTPGNIEIFQHIYQYRRFYSAMLSTRALPDLQQRIVDTFKELAGDVLPFEQLEESGISSHLFISYYAYALFGLIKEWVSSEFCYSPEYMAGQLFKILQHPPIGRAHH